MVKDPVQVEVDDKVNIIVKVKVYCIDTKDDSKEIKTRSRSLSVLKPNLKFKVKDKINVNVQI